VEVSKVKKGRSPVKAKRATVGKKAAKAVAKAKPKPRPLAKKRGKAAAPSGRRGTKPAATRSPVRSVKIRELDPLAKCGSGTSVQFLYRVDELLDGAPTAHLVFFDRHGWYCEHGRNCPAVADVRRLGRQQQLFTD
jgi:hypothetical protein